VEEGRRVGRTLGFPTANLASPQGAKLLPAVGVYTGWARVRGAVDWTPSVLNVGRAPTVGPDGPVRTEVHLLDTSGDFYGKQMQVAVAKRLRSEERFGGVGELQAAIATDVAAARAWHETPPAEARPQHLGAFPVKCAS
jgi:riboflavin kinase/FMN adenylyltransferase